MVDWVETMTCSEKRCWSRPSKAAFGSQPPSSLESILCRGLEGSSLQEPAPGDRRGVRTARLVAGPGRTERPEPEVDAQAARPLAGAGGRRGRRGGGFSGGEARSAFALADRPRALIERSRKRVWQIVVLDLAGGYHDSERGGDATLNPSGALEPSAVIQDVGRLLDQAVLARSLARTALRGILPANSIPAR